MSHKLNLLVDGNNFSWKALSVYDGIRGKKLFDINKERTEFLRILASNFKFMYLPFRNVLNKLIVTQDSKSWRYSIYADYKGNRTLDDSINWENYYILVKEFYTEIAKSGVIFSQVKGSEGDDLIYKWSKHLNLIGENCVIISSDRDLTQLAYFKENVFTVMYDKTYSKFFGTDAFFKSLDTKESVLDIFNIVESLTSLNELESSLSEVFNSLLTSSAMNIVDVDYFIFKKVLTGDKGDNVPSPLVVVKGKSQRKYGVGEKTAEKIIAEFGMRNFSMHLLFEDSFILKIAKMVIRYQKQIETSELLNKVVSNIKLNIKLMYLADSVYSNTLTADINTSINESKSYSIDMVSLKEVLQGFDKYDQPKTKNFLNFY